MAARAVTSSLGALSDARYGVAVAKHEKQQVRVAADLEAQQLERKGAQDLAAMRRALAGAGNLSALDYVGDEATGLAQRTALARYGGEVQAAAAQARARRAKQMGWQSVFGEAVGVGTQLLSGFGGGGFLSPKSAGDTLKV